MAKGPSLGQISSPVFSVGQLNTAFSKLDTAFQNTLSRDGSTPNNMLSDLDMDSNSILNADSIQGSSVTVENATIGGKLFSGTIEWRSDWLTATSYLKLDLVRSGGNLYICQIPHTSGVFMTDLTDLKWEIFIENTEGPTGPPGDDGLGLTDGDKGDITVSGSGSVMTIDDGVVTLAKQADMATASVVYRKTAGVGAPEVQTLATLKTDLGLSGANSGDQTSIVGITGTKAQFDTAVTDGDILYVGDVTQYTDEQAQDAVGGMVDASLTYVDGTPLLQRAALTGAVTASAGSNSTALGSFTKAELTAAVSDGDPLYGPAGSTTQLQYNNAGALAGASSALIEGNELRLPAISTPTTPAAAGAKIYGKSFAGRIMPTFLDPEGIERIAQEALQGRSVYILMTGNSSALTNIGGAATAVGISHVQTIASANPWQAIRRARASTTAIAGNASGSRLAYTQWFLGNAAGFGGFYFNARFGMNINLNGGQKFIGLCASTAILAGDPSALLNMIGVGYDSTDASSGNWFLLRNDGSGTATKVNLGANAARNTTDGYDLTMYAKPNSSEIFVRIVNLATGVLVLDTSYTTDIPAVNTGLAFKCDVRNGAVAAVDTIEHGVIYIGALQ